MKNNKLKEINIKSCTCYYFDDFLMKNMVEFLIELDILLC